MRIARYFAIVLGVFCVAQLVPYGREHANPPRLAEPAWDSRGTRTLFFRVCGDCHTNETTWPWYSFVAPVSWLVQYDVDEGRSHLNVSAWGHGEQEGDEAAEMVRDGEMPPWFYRPLHRSDQLSENERERFIRGLESTFGRSDDDTHHDHHED